jgi:FtsH-binding integral membrane protein
MSNFDRNAPVWGAGRAQQTSAVEMDQGLRSFMLGVYNNMVIGLAISALFALGVNKMAVTDQANAVARIGNTYLTSFGQLMYGTPLMWVFALAPLAFIFFFSFRIDRMSASSARSMFFAFAAVMGVSMSTLLIRYTGASVVQVFFITAAAFGGMGSFLVMGLIGLILASLVNIFLASSGLGFVISLVGVGIFAGLTAWDTQRLKEMYLSSDMNPEEAAKLSVNGALSLYLNFVNMFQFLLSLLGNRE